MKKDCIDIIVAANNTIDAGAFWGIFTPPGAGRWPFDVPEYHGDNGMIIPAMKVLARGWAMLTSWQKCPKDCEEMYVRLRLFGAYLHTLQDLYSHSDYVERNGGADPGRGEGKPLGNARAEGETDRIPLWDMNPDNPANREYRSGYYSRSEHIGAGQAGQPLMRLYTHLYMNKDSKDSIRGKMPNANGTKNFDLAVDVATRHTKKAWDDFVASMTDCARKLLEKCCEWVIVNEKK